MPRKKRDAEVIAEGDYIRMLRRNDWEYVERRNISGIVVIAPVTADGKLILIEQYRPPVDSIVIELPAGLAGDEDDHADEGLAEAAQRELLEETGYAAGRMELVTEGPVSPGTSAEVISLFLATGLKRVAEGGGDETEDITVHGVPLAEAHSWLEDQRAKGKQLDPKVYAGVYFALKSPER